MGLTFQIEPIAPNWDEFHALAQLHWQGTKSYHRHEPFLLSKERYQACNESGFLHFLTARDGARLAGYLIVYQTQSMHSQLPMIVEDMFFLHPDYRGGRNAIRFLQYLEGLCREWGIHEIMASCEIDNGSGIRRLLEHLDYREVVVQYSKILTAVPADSGISTMEIPADVCSITTPRT